MNKVIGYKAFNNMQDRFGNSYQLDVTYEVSGPVKFRKNGFHFCKNIEDVFRYYDGFDDNTIVCLVEGFGELDEYEDEMNEYFDMYSSSKLKILKILSRDEVLQIALSNGVISMLRFISGYKLTDEEINIILDRYHETLVEDYISYYQRGNKEVFQRKRK